MREVRREESGRLGERVDDRSEWEEHPGMTLRTIDPAQQTAARIAGLLYLFTSATAIFAEIFVRGRLIVRGDAVQTARNVAASERVFRLGIASDLITVLGVIALIWALYIVLKPINGNVALLAAFWRLAEASILAVSVGNALAAVLLLSGADSMQAFGTQQLQALAGLFVNLQGAGWRIGFVFLGLGSTVFSYLWLKSRYIPRALAAWGVFSSLVLAVVTLALMVFPNSATFVTLVSMAPMGVYELTLGFWLLAKGLRTPTVA
jgi:hypothetical protein